MPRLVKKTAKGPVRVGDRDICMCGLSESQPFCDTSHKKTLKEDDSKLYWYDEEGKCDEIETESECQGDCCGGCCQEDKKSK